MLLSEGRAGSAAAAGSPEEGNKHIPAQQGEDKAGWEVFITQVHPFLVEQYRNILELSSDGNI